MADSYINLLISVLCILLTGAIIEITKPHYIYGKKFGVGEYETLIPTWSIMLFSGIIGYVIATIIK